MAGWTGVVIGGVNFLGWGTLVSQAIIRHDPPPPRLSGTLPSPETALDGLPSDHVRWTSAPRIAQYDPIRQTITLNRDWQTSGLEGLHVIAHERHHANQPRWPVIRVSFSIIIPVLWGGGWRNRHNLGSLVLMGRRRDRRDRGLHLASANRGGRR